ncbi:MAG TPA: hypothetical protein VLI39_14285 [Sedimentisphaerales bacterium]|nr:hypothetical protein [Sedimentisphaerales bacterium]
MNTDAISQRLNHVEQVLQPSEEFPLTLELVGRDGQPGVTITYTIGTHGGVRERKRAARNGTVEKS